MALKRTESQKLMQLAAMECQAFRQESIDTEHILLAMMKTGGIETEALIKAGANYNTLRKIVMSNSGEGTSFGMPSRTSEAVRGLFARAGGIARQNGEKAVYADHILLAILNDKSGMATVMLTIADVDKKQVYRFLMDAFRAQMSDKGEGNLSRYARNLNSEAEKGKIDPVIGRATEINRAIQILSRRSKNNPVLIGEPGVGKTAIAEGLAQRIVNGDVPDIMANKTIYSLDMATMVAGTKYRGDFEQRLSDTLDEIIKRDDVIVFIDELHTIIGAGSSEGSLDASNILKPALSKGDLRLIGATTIEEYRKRIEKDAALERRFQPVMVDEPTKRDTIKILQGIRKNYENYHKIILEDSAIEAAVDLTSRYLPDRFLPDKAIDVVDEAMARLRVESFVVPDEVKELEEERERLENEKTRAALTQDFEEAAALRDRISELERRLESVDSSEGGPRQEWPCINEDSIAAIVSDWAHVPVSKLTESESDKYRNIDKKLKKSVIGQDYAVDSVSSALKRARVGLKSPDRPIGSFIFVGPTGVGKTYLAKQIAKELFGSDQDMIRIDMSEYMEKYSVSRLLGSAPGYVGYEEGGQLTEQVRSHSYSVILFDEIEKAHPDVFNVLLQVLDDGRLTDSQGRTVDFRNTVIILTSNVGAERLSKSNRLGFAPEEDLEQRDRDRMNDILHDELKKTFRPEFLNRIDDIVVFHRLSQASILKISKLLIDQLMSRVADLGYEVSYTPAVAQKLAKDAYEPEFGARPLERAIRNKLEDLLSEKMLGREIRQGEKYELCLRQGEIDIKIKEKDTNKKAGEEEKVGALNG